MPTLEWLTHSSDETIRHGRELGARLKAPALLLLSGELGAGKTTVVLKGYQTVIAAPDGRAWINSTGNPGMAKAGSGDVLTGVLAGILAQHATPSGNAADWDLATCLAVYLHGLAGDIAADKYGETSLMATDLIHAIPRAFAQLASERDDADA